MEYQIINQNQKDEWTQCIKKAVAFDLYHTWQYNAFEKADKPFLFLYQQNNDFIAFPLIKRKIDDSNFYDLTSAYGYVGPISNRQFTHADDVFLENFKTAFLQFLKKEAIICVFSRLHPIISQGAVLNKFGGVYDNGQTVGIDLNTPVEIQISKYRKGHRNAIKYLRQHDYLTKEVSTPEGVKTFVKIYHENMRRIKAANEYFFNEEYFLNLINAKEFDARIMLVYLNDEPIAGGVFTFTDQIIQVHLLGTLTEHLVHSPVKLLIDEVSLLGRECGMRYLHIGGGIGGQNDSLFYWKSGFSDLYFNFQTWRYINNQLIYNELVKSKAEEFSFQKTDFFPLYRKSSI